MSYGGKKWVMWPNNNFGVFETKWGLDYELWVLSLSYELWVLSYENWVMAKPNEPLNISKVKGESQKPTHWNRTLQIHG